MSDADINGFIDHIERGGSGWKAVEHNGNNMTKAQVLWALKLGKQKGFKSISQITDEMIEKAIKRTINNN